VTETFSLQHNQYIDYTLPAEVCYMCTRILFYSPFCMYQYPVGGVGGWQFYANKEWLLSWWPLLHWWFPCTCSHCNIISKLYVWHTNTSTLFELYYHTCHQGTHQLQQRLEESQWIILLQKFTIPHHIAYTNAFLKTITVCMSSAVINW